MTIRAAYPGGSAPTPDESPIVEIWLDRRFVTELREMKEPHESLSEVIVRRLGQETRGAAK